MIGYMLFKFSELIPFFLFYLVPATTRERQAVEKENGVTSKHLTLANRPEVGVIAGDISAAAKIAREAAERQFPNSEEIQEASIRKSDFRKIDRPTFP
jgi:hypothetical protein